MDIRLLGALTVRVNGRDVPTRSPLAWALLAVVILAPNQRISHLEIEKRLWPGQRVNRNRVRDVSRVLREMLPGLALSNQRLYCEIQLERHQVDYFRFVDGVVEAKRWTGRDRMDKLRQALQEWEGDPLLDSDLEKFDLCWEQELLDRHRRDATVDYLTAILDCGEQVEFRVPARSAVKRWPHDSRLVSLMAEVLADTDSENRAWSFVAGHIAEHGDPDGDLTEVQARFRSTNAGPQTTSTVHRQLPAPGSALVGRAAERRTLTRLLTDPQRAAAQVVVVTGMPGVGKTRLACACAAELEERFPGGTLYADLNGYGPLPPEEPAQILGRMLLDLGVTPPTKTLDGMITAFRSATTGRSVLVVLDNARNSAQVRPLLPGAGSAAVVTSRIRLDSLIAREGAHPFILEPLGDTDAVALLARALGESRMRQARHLVEEIADLVGGLPLALAVVAARVATRPAEAIRAIRNELRATKNRLDALACKHDTDLNVRLALSYSHSGLTSAAADLLGLLALHPGPTISLSALTVLAGRNCEDEVDELVTAHLLNEPVFERFTMHDLVRVYAGELVAEFPTDTASEATGRVYEFLLQNTWACDQALVPGRELPISTTPGMRVVLPQTPEDAMAWLDVEYPTITAVLRMAAEQGADRYTWLLAMALSTYQWRRSRFADADRYLVPATEAAERVADLPDQAMVYRMLAGSRWSLKQYPKAKGAQLRAVSLSSQAGDRRGVAYGHIGMAALHLDEDEHYAADIEYGKARLLFRELSDPLGEADALRGLGQVALALHDFDRAFRYCSEAHGLYEQTNDVNGQAGSLATLGRVHDLRGELSRAAATYDIAVSLYRNMTRDSHEARTLVLLADVLRRDGRAAESRTALARARALYKNLEDRSGLARVKKMVEGAGDYASPA